jgi:hypothetical protein
MPFLRFAASLANLGVALMSCKEIVATIRTAIVDPCARGASYH